MIKVYTAANLQDAHLILGLLNLAGIDARILNASAHGALGEIPFAAAYPEIWIDHDRDLARARQVLEGFEQPAVGALPMRCPNCSEDNPAGFELCWRCGSPTVRVS